LLPGPINLLTSSIANGESQEQQQEQFLTYQHTTKEPKIGLTIAEIFLDYHNA
jgi:hypothetical protein